MASTENKPTEGPSEYVSLFEGSVDELTDERDYSFGTREAVFTGVNQLLSEISDYLKKNRDQRTRAPPQLFQRLM